MNAGAFTHYSWAIHDALRSFEGPIVEVHLSNPSAREDFRHISVLSTVVNGTISGFGGFGYVLALQSLIAMSR
jgi:3-dehydroquinate dehydratase-2